MQGFVRTLSVLTVALFATAAYAQGQLNVVCSVQAPWCEAVANAFQKKGIDADVAESGHNGERYCSFVLDPTSLRRKESKSPNSLLIAFRGFPWSL